MSAPLVSVVVAVYNGEDTIGAALASLLAQDYEPFEVVVVDDGSTDGTAEIVRAFDTVDYVRQENHGPGAARNTGAARGRRGTFLAFLDADDEAVPDKLSLQVGYLQRNPAVGCVLGRQDIEFVGMDEPPWMKRDPVFGDLAGIGFTTAMIRRDAFEAVGGFDPDRRLQGSEDRDLMVRLRAAGVGIEVLPHVVIHRRFSGSNLTMQQPSSLLLRSLKSKLDREREGAS